VTLDQELDQELVEFMCERFEQCDCEEALETSVVALQADIADKHGYTLVPGALERMRAAYSRRLAELREVAK
jgi:hypothetical protein